MVDAFTQAEKELAEMSYQMDGLNERLDEADGVSSAQVYRLLSIIFAIISKGPLNRPTFVIMLCRSFTYCSVWIEIYKLQCIINLYCYFV